MTPAHQGPRVENGNEKARGGDQAGLHRESGVLLSGSLCLTLESLRLCLYIFGKEDGADAGERNLGLG